jgi:hypothetical protein
VKIASLAKTEAQACPPAVTAQSSQAFAQEPNEKLCLVGNARSCSAILNGRELKNRSGGNKYALQNKDTVISLPETFEVSRALQKKINVGSEKGKERLIFAGRLILA